MKKVKVLILIGGLALGLMGLIWLPGSQPNEGRLLEDYGSCNCHRNYLHVYYDGSMHSQSARDPIFWAAVDVANSNVPESGEFCIRCHAGYAWTYESGGPPTDGSLFLTEDYDGIQCDFCHALVDPLSAEGQSLQSGTTLVTTYGNGQFVVTNGPNDEKRGPVVGMNPPGTHNIVESPFHETAQFCGQCHTSSNPNDCPPGEEYTTELCFPLQRTYQEWKNSWYGLQGDTVQACSNCHMPPDFHKVANSGSNWNVHNHDFLGANTFAPLAVIELYSGDVDTAALIAGNALSLANLQGGNSLDAYDKTAVSPHQVDVKIKNTGAGHKFPTGQAAGRRMWVNVIGYDSGNSQVFESGAYDGNSALLTLDGQIKVYEAVNGVSGVDGCTDATASFNLMLNDCVIKDNRIPPRGFTNAAFAAVRAEPVGYTYADGQNWDTTSYTLPWNVVSVDVNVYYQTLSYEYFDFLTTHAGSTAGRDTDLITAYNNNGKSAPELISSTTLVFDTDQDGLGDAWEMLYWGDLAMGASGNPDSDAFTNIEEYMNGTNPAMAEGCTGDAACDDGLWCNGAETCVGSTCQMGTPPAASDGVACTDDTCDEAGDTIINTANDANCDDGLWCNGSETCDALLDCQAGIVVDCDDGMTCSTDACDEAGDTCTNSVCSPGYLAADGINGGQMFDKFWAAETGVVLTGATAATVSTYSNFFRCKQCHGWDRLGNNGAYISRAPSTTRPNVTSIDLQTIDQIYSVEELFDAIKYGDTSVPGLRRNMAASDASLPTYTPGGTVGDKMPDFGEILTDAEIWDMVKFFFEEAVDMTTLYADSVTGTYPTGSWEALNLGTDGNASTGNAIYTASCASCHGSDGLLITVDGGAWPGVGPFIRSKGNEAQHKMKFGQLGTGMINILSNDQDIKDVYKAMNNTVVYPDQLADTDNDGIPDNIENANCTSSSAVDTDGDGLCDGNVSFGSTCTAGEDMNGDGFVDPTETDPCVADTDGDGLDDGTEAGAGLDPLAWDTDGDFIPDGYEVANSGSVPPLDPLSAADGSSDFDADGNSNYHEYYNGSDPWVWNPVGGTGCESWGDAGGDGTPDPTDIVELAKAVRGLGPNYSNVLPTSGMGQDVDADGTPSPVDITQLKGMVRGLSTVGMGSRPNTLVVLEQPSGPVTVGDTCHLTIGVLNDNASYSPAFGVIFEISVSSTGSATILGGDGASGSGRYSVSGDAGSSRVVFRIDSAGTIDIDVTLPGCGVPVVGRYSPTLTLNTVAISGQALPAGYDSADGINGGQMFDKFWAMETGVVLTGATATTVSTYSNFFRCKQCHGWDRYGSNGAYISRAPSTSRPNVTNLDLRDIDQTYTVNELFNAIKYGNTAIPGLRRTIAESDASLPTYTPGGIVGDKMPDFGELLTDAQIWDVVKFFAEEAIDPRTLYSDSVTGTYPTGSWEALNLGTDGDAGNGDAIYTSTCATCHNADGKAFSVDGGAYTGVGQFIRAKGNEGQHKIKFGQLGTGMINLIWDDLDVKDIYKAMNNTATYPD